MHLGQSTFAGHLSIYLFPPGNKLQLSYPASPTLNESPCLIFGACFKALFPADFKPCFTHEMCLVLALLAP